jgi:hypothetical protein
VAWSLGVPRGAVDEARARAVVAAPRRCDPRSRGDAGKQAVVGTSYSPRSTTGDIEQEFAGADAARLPKDTQDDAVVSRVPPNYRFRPGAWKIKTHLEGAVAGRKWTPAR